MTLTFEAARAEFPVLERFAYLNAGTFGPLARRTTEAMTERLRTDLELGRGGGLFYQAVASLRERIRGLLAAELGVPAEHVALTASTTDACNVVLAGLGLAPEDEIVTTDSEHFGLLGALHVSGARVRVARIRERDPRPAGVLDAILAEIGPRTRLVAVSHVLWTTGNVLPIAELKDAVAVPVIVDGAQAVGAIPVEAAAFDFYTVSGQKWLCGPDPTGALYVADPERLRVTRPSMLVQRSFEPDGSFVPRAGAARFDTGWTAPAALAGLDAALDGVPEWRFERAAEMARRCRELLARDFEVITEPGHATIVSFRPGDDAALLARQAFDRGVILRDLPGLGWLRASCGYWTNDQDLQRLVEALAAASSRA